MERYTMISGEAVEYERPAPEVAAFLARVVDAANDPSVTESDLTDLIYGTENPILKQGILPHHGVVTQEVFASPVYHVMTDLLGRKRVQAGTLNLTRARDEYTMTVADAAKQLGVHPSAVRQAIQVHKLDAMKRGGVHLLRPSSVASYHVSRRGPAPRAAHDQEDPALDVTIGSEAGRSARLRVVGGELQVRSKHAAVVHGVVPRFTRAVLIVGGEGKHRLFVLEPSDERDEISVSPFGVRGRFHTVMKENNPRRARAEWKRLAEEDSGN